MPLTDRPPTGKAWACTEGQRRIPATRPSGGAATSGDSGQNTPGRPPSAAERARARPHQVAELSRLLAVIVQAAQGAGPVLVHPQAGEAEDYSSEEEEAEGRDDEDIFTELPLYEAFFNGVHRRNVSQRKQTKHELTKFQHICHIEDCDDHSEKELKDHDKAEKHTELETQPEWSDSLSCLMKKLERLNLDIEEALSAGSSPSGTPSAKRHRQLCPVQVETGFYGDHQGKASWINRRADYQDLDCLSYPVSSGARPKTDVIYECIEHKSVRLSGRVLWATLHVYRMAHMIELEPLTCTIVVRGKSKVGRFKLD
ncbi:putative LOC102091609 [Columba livia]|uniref:Putative LOC102091609 n=1 Tax=Columba livia TaxID=8932 RepID=A0A2I0MD17_COLLI|nr:putative LOC102091609 [Columba livia]